MKKITKPTLSKTTGKPIDAKRSRAAKKAAATRARNKAEALNRQSLRLHHKIIAGGMIVVVLAFTILGVRNQIQAYAATTATGTFVGLSSKCLDNNASQAVNRNYIQLYTCNGTNAQRWTLASNGSIISNNGSNYCLDIPGANKAEYTYLQLYSCNGTKAQKFTVSNNTLISTLTGYCVTVKYGETTNKTRLWMKTCHGNTSQKWTYSGGSGTTTPITGSAPITSNTATSGSGSGSSSTSTPVAAGTRYVSDQPFASNSIWNTAIGANASSESTSGSRTAKLINGGGYINSNNGYSIPVNIASSSDPTATVKVSSPSGTFSHKIPNNAIVASGSDGNLDVVVGRYLYEYWQLKGSGSSYSANSGYKTDLYGSGINTGIRAASFSTLGGLIRAKEVSSKSINHALVMAIPLSYAKHGYVWPASSEDWNGSSAYGGTIPLGTLFAIPGSVNVNNLGLTGEGLALARAMQDYGVYVGDTSGQTTLYAEPSVQSGNGGGYNNMLSDWQKKLLPQLRAVTNNTSSNLGGGGTPRKSALPAPSVTPGSPS